MDLWIFQNFDFFRVRWVEKGRFWVIFRVARPYRLLGFLDFHDFWYVEPKAEPLKIHLWIFQNFDFFSGQVGPEGSIWVIFRVARPY